MAHAPKNRLARERSPYLLQHAGNPVDWWPWGDEAIAEARRRDVPIFLSIGYSTCYWCHVMERESFENEAIARELNDRFVCIKVDREERPDLDDAYMAATQMMTGHGGWPMSVFLEPVGLKPFFAGTYFPPTPSRGMPSVIQVARHVSEVYAKSRGDAMKQAENVARAVREHLGGSNKVVSVGAAQVGMAVQTLLTIVDRADGGFGRAPKFPQPVYLELLLAAREFMGDPSHREGVDQALRLTLDRMALGGMFDQVGGGFHRYSVDTHWTVPHFEKMLYDQGQLLGVYANAARVYEDPFYARVARRTAAYVVRELTSDAGATGFFTAQDAEVDGREGVNYLWSRDEVIAACGGSEDGAFACDLYGLDGGPNFQDPHHPDLPPANVLRLAARPEVEAARMGMSVEAFWARIDDVNQRLYAARAARKQPRLDDKVIASWNGLMIDGLARAGAALDEPAFLDAAERAATFVLTRMRTADGALARVHRLGSNGERAVLEDYAMLAQGLVSLHGAGRGDGRWRREAEGLVAAAFERFGDGNGGGGGVFDTTARPDLFVRARSTYDGAMPAGASVLLNVLVSLHEETKQKQWIDLAFGVLAPITGAMEASPISTANAVRAVLRLMAIDADALSVALAARGAEATGAPASTGAAVDIYADVDEVELGPDQPTEVNLRLEIPTGWHINDAFAGAASGGGVVPLEVSVIDGTGVRPYAEYPRGTPMEGATHGVHEGVVEFAVVLEAEGDWTGAPKLAVTYQMCNDRACGSPARAVLGVRITRDD